MDPQKFATLLWFLDIVHVIEQLWSKKSILRVTAASGSSAIIAFILYRRRGSTHGPHLPPDHQTLRCFFLDIILSVFSMIPSASMPTVGHYISLCAK